MKKIIIAIASLCIASTCFAGDGIQFGVMGGLTSTSTDLKTAIADVKTINQFHVGVCAKMPLILGLVFQPGIEYNVKGASIENITSVSGANIQWKTGYLEMPLQLQWGLDLGILRPYVLAEPFLGFAMTNQQEIKLLSTATTGWDNVKQRFEYGVSLGAGVELFSHLQVSVKYFWNFGQVYGADLSISGIKTSVAECSIKGLAATATILF